MTKSTSLQQLNHYTAQVILSLSLDIVRLNLVCRKCFLKPIKYYSIQFDKFRVLDSLYEITILQPRDVDFQYVAKIHKVLIPIGASWESLRSPAIQPTPDKESGVGVGRLLYVLTTAKSYTIGGTSSPNRRGYPIRLSRRVGSVVRIFERPHVHTHTSAMRYTLSVVKVSTTILTLYTKKE